MRPRALVVGGGIAGVGVAAALAPTTDVTLIEREASLAFHTTGRSAAVLFENYGAAPVRPLTRASRRFLDDPPHGLTDHPLLSTRGGLFVGTPEQRAELAALLDEGVASGATVEPVGAERMLELCPVLRGGVLTEGVWEPDASDIDVAGLHQAFVRMIRSQGGEVRTGVGLHRGRHTGTRWEVDLGTDRWHGDLVIDAAGAWGDEVADLCGVDPVGLTAHRRTAFMVEAPEASAAWPLVIDAANRFYFKPDGPQLLCSLADESPEEPGDARPRELDVALAIDRINTATTLAIRHVRSSWAGQRTFTRDRAMVIGPDPGTPSFVWLVGQGGTGIQTAHAAGRLAANLALGDELPSDLADAGVDLSALAPDRFR